jgi:hypothetical protein
MSVRSYILFFNQRTMMIIGCSRNELEALCKVIVVTLTRFALYLDTQTEHMVYTKWGG